MNFHIITLFPESFDSYLRESIIGKAIKAKKIKIYFYNPRDYVTGKYRKVWPDGNISKIVDDRPFGGGPGMIIRAEPVIKAVEKALKKANAKNGAKLQIVNFVPSGKKFTTSYAKAAAKKYTDLVLICGRYEGIDARIDKVFKTQKLSIGDYVLTGGELPAMVVIDSVSRQIKGVLGKMESLEEERVSSSEFYTRPEVLEYKGKKYKVPPVLLSGDHKKIEEWKKKNKEN
ncbi:MAG: tRNA (guanosine(37)-N1)-methyltransferase TrmD [Candidatus Paceibacterota bacterium]|nr:tRNA (guanosine(37)-N1)-methyltransferase TrmD [Candidatus Nomurabacteria bacterium]